MSFPNGVRLSDSIASKIIQGGFPADLDGLRFNAALNIWEFVPFGGGAGGLTFARIIKTADEVINNSTVQQNDDELLWAANANRRYGFIGNFLFATEFIPDIKFGWSVPAGATMEWAATDLFAVSTFDQTQTIVEAGAGVAIHRNMFFTGRVLMAGTAGNINMQWSQNVLDPTDTTVFEGAYLIVWQDT